MRKSFSDRLSLEGYWEEDSQDLIKTKIYYRLLSFGQMINLRSNLFTSEECLAAIYRVENIAYMNMLYSELTDISKIRIIIKEIFNKETYQSLVDTIIKDSTLSAIEFTQLSFITYYLTWKADETSRKFSYNCDQCKKFKYLTTRYCFLEDDEIELPHFSIEEDEDGVKDLKEEDSKLKTVDDYYEMLNSLTWKDRELSLFEIHLKYFSGIVDDRFPGKRIEVCPEAFKMKSENLAELFEMEARASEYHVLPFHGGQLDQLSLVLESFDAIRSTRNLFHSQKMRDISKSK